jgi:sec-independent protein translocase protein TatA
MGSVGWPELLVIALIALLLFGAGRIADIGKGLGQGISNFKKGLKEGEDEAAAKKKLPADTKTDSKKTDEDKVAKASDKPAEEKPAE